MRVFVTGGTGALGRFLIPQLAAAGHEVVALVRSSEKADQVKAAGAQPVLADPLDKPALTAAVVAAQPGVIVHQLTALSGMGDFKNFDQEFALTNRFRTEVTDTLIEAGRAAGVRRIIAQSFCGWPYAREGGPVKTEDDPLDPDPPEGFGKSLAAIRQLEDRIKQTTYFDALALRYGIFYGPGTSIADDGRIVTMVKDAKLPIVGDGAGVWSFIHVHDAAAATVAAVTHGAPGIYNIVDDEPAPVSSWLPELAEAIGAKPPSHVPAFLAGFVIGEGGVSMMTKVRGGSNEKAKRELAWQPLYASWRRGFGSGLRS